VRSIDVELGKEYVAKVSGRSVKIRIEERDCLGGWFARNLDTGRRIRIRSPRRLTPSVELYEHEVSWIFRSSTRRLECWIDGKLFKERTIPSCQYIADKRPSFRRIFLARLANPDVADTVHAKTAVKDYFQNGGHHVP
jgi:hypothetical protein